MAALSGHSFSILEEFLICEKKKKKKIWWLEEICETLDDIVASFVHGYAFLKINK